MNRTLLALMMVLCSVASAQVEVVYPYNPDGNADSMISAPDLLDLLPIFGGPFTPEEITVNGEGLSTALEEMQSVLDSLDDFVIQASTGRTWQWPMGCHGEILTKVLVEKPDIENCGGEYVVPNDHVLFLTTSGGTITAQRGAVAQPIIIDPEFGGPVPIDEGVVLKNCNWSNVLISGVLIEKTPEVEIVFTDMEHVVPEGFFFKPYVVIAPLHLQTGIVDSDGYPVLSGIDYGGSVIATEGMSVSGSLILGYQAPLDLFLTPVNTEESASPICEDIDEDGICDFADACIVDVCGVCGGDGNCCGNGIVEGDEECDDGNEDPTDGCDGCQAVELWDCGSPIEYSNYWYETVDIYGQCWFAENLRTTYYANGEIIEGGLTDNEWVSTSEGANATVSEELGRVYNFMAVTNDGGLCPVNWRVPSAEDFDELSSALGDEVAGYRMKASPPLWNGDNFSGFSGQATGYKGFNGAWQGAGSATFWTSSGVGATSDFRELQSFYDVLGESIFPINYGLSVRCIKDQ